MPGDARGIISGISIEYFNKARGCLIAESTCNPLEVSHDINYQVYADNRDSDGDVVARITVTWRLGREHTSR